MTATAGTERGTTGTAGPGRLRRLAPVGLLIALAVLACGPAWITLTAIWQGSFTYAHGWLIALVSVFLVTEVAPLLPAPSRPSPGATIALGVCAALYVAAGYAHVDIVQQLLLPVLPLALLTSVYGLSGGRRLAFPLLFLWLAVPVWDALIPVLQHLTILANGYALAALGVPAQIDGDLVRVPAGVFEVAGGCSGQHFFVVALAVSVLHGYLRRDGLGAALRGIVLALALALVTNWLRVLIIILRGNATAMRSSLIHDHYWFGWGLFAGALVIYFAVMHWLNPKPLPPPEPLPTVAPPAPRVAQWLPGTVVLLLVTGYGYVHGLGWAAVALPDLSPPVLAGPAYSGPLLDDFDYHPSFPGAPDERLATYRGPAGRVVYYRVAYAAQHSGQKLIGYGSSVAPEGWSITAESVIDTPGGGHGPVPARLREARVRSGAGREWRVWYWYSVGGQRTADPRTARYWQAAQAYTPLAPAGLSALAAPCIPECDAALGTLASFAAILGDNGHVMTHQSTAMPQTPTASTDPGLHNAAGGAP